MIALRKIAFGGLLVLFGSALGFTSAQRIDQSTAMNLGNAHSWTFMPVDGHPSYRSRDGKYTFKGTIIDNAQYENISETQMAGFRKASLAAISDVPIINFPSSAEKYRVFVFSDIECIFCRTLHEQREEFARRGISLAYVLYPREGMNSRSFRKASLVACSTDQQEALTRLMEGGAPEVVNTTNACAEAVANGWKLGKQLGVEGTPAIVLPSGRLLNRYLTANQLLAELNADAAHAKEATRIQ